MEGIPQKEAVKPIGVVQNEINDDFGKLEIFLNGEAEPSSGDVGRAIVLAEKIKKIKADLSEEDLGALNDQEEALNVFIEKNRRLA